MQLNQEQIREILPHRYPFLLIDKVEDYKEGEWAKAIKCVSANEPFFQGHFPQKPIMPGVLILEALAQTGAVALLAEPANKGKIALFAGVKNIKFKNMVVPGDVLVLECKMTKRYGNFGWGEVTAKVGDKEACSGEISFAILDEESNQN